MLGMKTARRITMLMALIVIAVIAVGAWFGYQFYLDVTHSSQIGARMTTVLSAWDADPSAQSKAKNGKGGVLPKDLPTTPYTDLGAIPAVSYQIDERGTTLIITYKPTAATTGWCARTYQPTIDLTDKTVSVLLTIAQQSNPLDVLRYSFENWKNGCRVITNAAPQIATVTLRSPLKDRVVVDAQSGKSLTRAKATSP